MFISCANEIKTWNSDSFELLNEHVYFNKTKPINNFVIRPDNQQIASVIDKSCIGIWDIEAKSEYNLKEACLANCCTYDSTGRFLAVGNTNGIIDVYDFKSQTMKKKSIKILQSPSESINCIVYTNKDRFIVTGNSNGTIVLYNTLTNQITSTLVPGGKKDIIDIPLTYFNYSSFNTSNLVAAYEDGSVILWDLMRSSPSFVSKSHTSPCTSVVLSPLNDFFLVSGGLDGIIALHDTSSKEKLKSIKCLSGVTSIDMHKNGSTLCVGTINGTIQMYDLRNKTDEPFYIIKAHDNVINCVKFFQNINSNSMNGTNSLSIHQSYANQTINSNNSIKKTNSSNQEVTVNDLSNYMISNKNNPICIYSPEVQNNCLVKTNSNILKESINTSNHYNDGLSNDSFIINNSKKIPTNYSKSTSNLLSAPIFNSTKFDSTTTNENFNNINNEDKSKKLSISNKISRRGDLYSPISNMKNENSPIQSTLRELNNLSPKQNINKDKSVNAQEKVNSDISPNINSTELFKTIQVDEKSIHEKISQESNQSKTVNINFDNNSLSVIEQNLKNSLKDVIDEFRDELMSENFKFKAELIKEFIILKDEINKMVKSCSINEELLSEIAKLKEENNRLKKMF